MRAKIGKYPSRLTCNIHRNYMEKKYGLIDWSEHQSLFESVLERLDDGIQYFYNIINTHWLDNRQQKIDVRVDRWDTWSADHTLAHIILPVLIRLKYEMQGAPSVADEDVPEKLRSTNAKPLSEEERNNGAVDEFWFDRWGWVMDEMIFAFDSKVGEGKDWEDDFWSGESDISWTKADNGYSELVRGPNHTSKFDKIGHDAYQERISNGFRLFGRYYEGLWS